MRPDALVATSWYESSARERLAELLDPGSFTEIIPPTERCISPHLAGFDLPSAFDDGIVIGSGRLEGNRVLVAAQESSFLGGTFGEVHGAKMIGLLRAAAGSSGVSAVLLLLDTGGVRLQEANAGEIAVGQAIVALLEARAAGVPVLALIGGRAGCFGGGGLIAGSCSAVVISEQGRLGVSGPEVIETNRGVEEFDARDRPLVWRITGGRTCRLLGIADAYVEDTIDAFRTAANRLLADAPPLDLPVLLAEHETLAQRLAIFGDCRDAPEIGSSCICSPQCRTCPTPHSRKWSPDCKPHRTGRRPWLSHRSPLSSRKCLASLSIGDIRSRSIRMVSSLGTLIRHPVCRWRSSASRKACHSVLRRRSDFPLLCSP